MSQNTYYLPTIKWRNSLLRVWILPAAKMVEIHLMFIDCLKSVQMSTGFSFNPTLFAATSLIHAYSHTKRYIYLDIL